MNELTIPSTPPLQRRWSDRFALDFAMTLEGSGSKPQSLLAEYGYLPSDLAEFSREPLFMRKVEQFQKQLQENGFTFKVKAQMQAEELLDTSWELIHADVSPAVKADLIKWTAKVAGFEPTGGKDGGVGNAVQININMGDPSLSAPPGIRTIENV